VPDSTTRSKLPAVCAAISAVRRMVSPGRIRAKSHRIGRRFRSGRCNAGPKPPAHLSYRRTNMPTTVMASLRRWSRQNSQIALVAGGSFEA